MTLATPAQPSKYNLYIQIPEGYDSDELIINDQPAAEFPGKNQSTTIDGMFTNSSMPLSSKCVKTARVVYSLYTHFY